MNVKTNLGSALVAGTALLLPVVPTLAQDRAGNVLPASDNARPAAAMPANVGEIGAHAIDIYEKQMRAAMSITDPPRRDAAVTLARQQLAQNTGRPLTAGTIADLDGILDIGGVSPQLGATG
jgi:hypothetical protein